MSARMPDRPYAPGYGIAEKAEGMLSWEWVSAQMAQSRSYWVCSTRPDGRPHAIPVWGVWLDEVLYFSTARSSRKGRNLAASPEVVIHLESGDDCVIFEGVVEDVSGMDAALDQRYNDAYEAKYNFRPGSEPADSPNVIYALRPRAVLAWQEQDFPNTATRWRFS